MHDYKLLVFVEERFLIGGTLVKYHWRVFFSLPDKTCTRFPFSREDLSFFLLLSIFLSYLLAAFSIFLSLVKS